MDKNLVGYSKEDFIQFWGKGGYSEPCTYASYYSLSKDSLYKTLISPFENTNHICLEIGCGAGVWSNMMTDKFLKNIAIDVIPRPSSLNQKISYYELESFNYKCSGIEDNSIDFVFSFGVFCHLPVSAQFEYIENIVRVLKPMGNSVLMFADWETHPDLSIQQYEYREKANSFGWFYMDKNIIREILEKNNINNHKDLLPSFRDRVIHFQKL